MFTLRSIVVGLIALFAIAAAPAVASAGTSAPTGGTTYSTDDTPWGCC